MASRLAFLLLLLVPTVLAADCNGYQRTEKVKVFNSPSVTSRPGIVNNKYFDVEAPTGHFATVDFNAELVYDNGEPVPLTDVYLHHWILLEYESDASPEHVKKMANMNPANSYLGKTRGLRQAWAKGGETRHLNSYMPAPYGSVSGGDGVKTKWMVNLHGIDTRGAAHRWACTECRCDLFSGGNRTQDLPEDYIGGLYCCEDETRCKLREGFNGDDVSFERKYHLQYTWTYIDYDECIVPLTQMGLDVTVKPGYPRGTVEYDVMGHCHRYERNKPECVDTREVIMESRLEGTLVYAVSHLHAFSLDSILYGEDGREICHSSPIYGHGHTAGDERGYVVGITHCVNGADGLTKIKKGEKLRYVVTYTKVGGPHTGVMGVMFLKLAEEGAITTSVGSISRKMLK